MQIVPSTFQFVTINVQIEFTIYIGQQYLLWENISFSYICFTECSCYAYLRHEQIKKRQDAEMIKTNYQNTLRIYMFKNLPAPYL